MDRKVYFILLSGQGDVHVKFVDEASFNWLFEPFPGTPGVDYSAKDPNVPEHMRTAITAWAKAEGLYEGEEDELTLSIGSFENDRAMAAVSTIDGYEPVYYDLKEAMAALKANGDDVENTYTGGIY